MLLNRTFFNFEMAQKAVQKAIESYNHFRPHRSCGYLTPNQAHRMKGELPKKWRVRKSCKQEISQHFKASLPI